MFEKSDRLKKLPPYLFVEIDRKKKSLVEAGRDVIDFGIGDPDLPTPAYIVEAMKKALDNPAFHRYPSGRGSDSFRKEIRRYYKEKCGVNLNHEDEISVLIGSKEGIAHLPWAVLNPGEATLVPEPGYPVYHIGTVLAEGLPYFMPLKRENSYCPDLSAVPADILQKAKILFLNYPNNPTSSFADRDFLVEAIDFCKKRGIIIAYDAAYSEIYFDERPASFLSLPGAKDIGVEFNSLSKTFNMTGWRAGWVCGNRDVVAALAAVKSNIDSGLFEAVQSAGVEALKNGDKHMADTRKIYKRRRDIFAEGFGRMGFDFHLPSGTFYFWSAVKGSSMKFADYLLENAGIVATPGVGFGPSGEGFIRFSLTMSENKITEAVKRMEDLWKER